MLKLLLFCILLVLCWPVWLLTIPFRLAGVAAEGALALVAAIFMFPVRVLRRI